MKRSLGGTSYAVLTADVAGSRQVASFRSQRDKKLDNVSKLHLGKKFILSPYAVTAWDEFQVILRKPEYIPTVLLDLRRFFYPLRLWIAVGFGEVTGARRQPVNQYAGGMAFEFARKAADQIKAGNPKYVVLTCFKTGDEVFDTIANSIYHLHDSLLNRVTTKQWAAINLQIETGRMDEIARKRRVDVSTISRTLKRSHYWQMEETRQAMEKIIQYYF